MYGEHVETRAEDQGKTRLAKSGVMGPGLFLVHIMDGTSKGNRHGKN